MGSARFDGRTKQNSFTVLEKHVRNQIVGRNHFITKCVHLLLGLLILTSCSKHKTETSTTLESEWVQVENQFKFLFDSADIGLVFRKDTLWSTSDYGWVNQGQYSIDETKITFSTSTGTTNWTILAMTNDSLTILRARDTLKYYNKRLEFETNMKYKKMMLRTGLCFAGCQEFEVQLDGSGNVEFHGLKNGKVIETKHYLMDENSRSKIDTLFKEARISKIDSTRYYGRFDDWIMTMKFEYGENQVVKVNGTSSNMPYRLKPIIGTLINDLRKRALIK